MIRGTTNLIAHLGYPTEISFDGEGFVRGVLRKGRRTEGRTGAGGRAAAAALCHRGHYRRRAPSKTRVSAWCAPDAYSTASDRLFQQHPTTCSTGIRPIGGGGLRQRCSSLIPTLSVKGGMGAEGCPREGPARPAPRPPRGWRCRARGRDRWATRGGFEAHFAASVAVSRSPSAPALRSDGPSRAMR